jgi:hypothetical protein
VRKVVVDFSLKLDVVVVVTTSFNNTHIKHRWASPPTLLRFGINQMQAAAACLLHSKAKGDQ